MDLVTYAVARPGDLARVEENVSSNAAAKKSAKSKKTVSAGVEGSRAAEGVVYKVQLNPVHVGDH